MKILIYCNILFSIFFYTLCVGQDMVPYDPASLPLYFTAHMSANNYKYETALEFLTKYEAYKAFLESAAQQPPYNMVPSPLSPDNPSDFGTSYPPEDNSGQPGNPDYPGNPNSPSDPALQGNPDYPAYPSSAAGPDNPDYPGSPSYAANPDYPGIQGRQANPGYSGYQGQPGPQRSPGYSGYQGYHGRRVNAGYPGNQHRHLKRFTQQATMGK